MHWLSTKFLQWSLSYLDTSVPKLTVRITEYPDKWDTFYICVHKWFPNMCPDKWIIRISEAWLYLLSYLLFILAEYMMRLHTWLKYMMRLHTWLKKSPSLFKINSQFIYNEIHHFHQWISHFKIIFQFDGENGDAFRQSCAIFCRNQSHALDLLRSRQKKDTRFSNFLAVSIKNKNKQKVICYVMLC